MSPARRASRPWARAPAGPPSLYRGVRRAVCLRARPARRGRAAGPGPPAPDSEPPLQVKARPWRTCCDHGAQRTPPPPRGLCPPGTPDRSAQTPRRRCPGARVPAEGRGLHTRPAGRGIPRQPGGGPALGRDPRGPGRGSPELVGASPAARRASDVSRGPPSLGECPGPAGHCHPKCHISGSRPGSGLSG